MGRPPSNGNPTFRFNQTEVAEMESILQEHNAQMPTRELLEALAEKFSKSAERSGKILVQMKQVWNWFQNRRYAIRAKTAKAPGKLSISPMPREDSSVVRNVSQAPQSATVPSAVQSAGRTVSDNSQMEFEAKSARDGAWYDVAMFISHRSLETGEPILCKYVKKKRETKYENYTEIHFVCISNNGTLVIPFMNHLVPPFVGRYCTMQGGKCAYTHVQVW